MRSALEDLHAVETFLSRGDPLYARSVVDRLLDAGDRLAKFPRSGPPAPSRQEPDARELVAGEGEYILKYRIIAGAGKSHKSEIVEIIAVIPARARQE